jgi:serine O-acetyltransferase
MVFSPLRHLQSLKSAIAADHEQIRRYNEKYHGEQLTESQLPIDIVQKIGMQMITVVRVMQVLDQAGVPVLPKVISRLIRHLYGAEIHWQAKIEPGVSIVHGCGLVISHAAKIGSGCLLFQNVTLGESVDPISREVGAPSLGRDVHIGPGATLIGPIVVGDRTKIMAGAVLTQSVPPDSLVRPAESIVTLRRRVTENTQETPTENAS